MNKYSEQDANLILIAKYLNNETDSNETDQVISWINFSDENKLEFEKLHKTWDFATAGIGMPEWKASRAKEQFLLKVIKTQSEVIKSKCTTDRNRKKLTISVLKYAAVAIFLIGISSLWFYSFDDSGKNYTQIVVAKGSKSQMTLPDGSKVWLNADSKIKYANNFNENNRQIILEGEAYFEVAKNPKKIFMVQTGGIVVQALGTVFNVKAYPEENVVETTLLEGSVSVTVTNNSDQQTILKPNEQVFYYKPDTENNLSDKILITKGIKPEVYTSWINDKFIISSETLEALTVKLGRKYDVNFHFEDSSLRELRFTGILENETIEQILDVLTISSPVNYRIQEREIWLTRNPQK